MAETQTLDQRLLAGQLRQEKRQAENEAEQEEEMPPADPVANLKAQVAAAKKRKMMKKQMMKKQAAKAGAAKLSGMDKIKGSIKRKIIEGVPGSGVFIIFSKVIGIKSPKLTIADYIIIAISDWMAFLIVFAAIVIIALIVDFMEGSWYDRLNSVIEFLGGVTQFNWEMLKALISLFS